MERQWNLELLYPSYESKEYIQDFASLDSLIAKINEFSESLSTTKEEQTLLSIIDYLSEYKVLARTLGAFISLQESTNTTDPITKKHSNTFDTITSHMAKASARFNRYIANVTDLEALIQNNELLQEHAFLLREIKMKSQYLKSDEVEELISKLNLTAGDAWSSLQQYLTSTLKIQFKEKQLTLSQIRNFAYSNDPVERKDAYHVELEAYDKIKDAICFSLNSIKGQVNTLCELRGYDSPLSMTLINSRMKQETLDAMLDAIRLYLPKFREYMKRKGELLGHPNGLPWYDLFALLGSSNRTYTIEDSQQLLVQQFSVFSDDMVEMINRAYEEQWIDFLPRLGKVGGAFCANIPPIKQSRILTNFDGSLGDCVTLAHELGHAYHGQQIQHHRPLNTGYTMPVAETASTFNETLLMQAAIAAATSTDEKLMLIESSLQDLNQVIVDIYSRYLFETEVFERRKDSFLFPKELEDIMTRAQKEAYGDGLDSSTLHPFMWVNKSHYYSPGLNFYNFPYAFGALFARGLYATYQKEGTSFVAKYKALLSATTIKSVEDVALMIDIDITKKEFWCSSLDIAADMIDEFLHITKS